MSAGDENDYEATELSDAELKDIAGGSDDGIIIGAPGGKGGKQIDIGPLDALGTVLHSDHFMNPKTRDGM